MNVIDLDECTGGIACYLFIFYKQMVVIPGLGEFISCSPILILNLTAARLYLKTHWQGLKNERDYLQEAARKFPTMTTCLKSDTKCKKC